MLLKTLLSLKLCREVSSAHPERCPFSALALLHGAQAAQGWSATSRRAAGSTASAVTAHLKSTLHWKVHFGVAPNTPPNISPFKPDTTPTVPPDIRKSKVYSPSHLSRAIPSELALPSSSNRSHSNLPHLSTIFYSSSAWEVLAHSHIQLHKFLALTTSCLAGTELSSRSSLCPTLITYPAKKEREIVLFKR